jgi:secondary thiamine-phosphate synthase enzyme
MIKTIELSVASKKSIEMIDITSEIKREVEESRIKEGSVKVFIPHTTAGLTINENSDPFVQKDILSALADVVPESSKFYHLEGNSDAHLKSSLFGVNVELIVHNSQLVLGNWQSVYFCEFDGPRSRKVWVQISGD